MGFAPQKEASEMMTDPVCGMKVDSKTAPTTTYEGTKYAFCGEDCKEKFEKNPQRYAETAQKVGR